MKSLLVIVTAIIITASPSWSQAASVDFDGDGTVGFGDFLLFVEAYGSTSATYDVDTDGTVGFGDFLVLTTFFGQSTTPSLPNILLIIADDVGLDASPGYNFGDTKPTMPTLESLTTQGVIYDNVWSAPLCSPTRATILTGRYGFRTGVLSVDNAISESETSIQQYLQQNAAG